ncbi:MAG: sigma-54 dependent transcriptional regulator [Clostridiales bacterium]|nr:sigma-54 dependent transcriptional regulator [Clostridiales bacterium]
MELNNNDLIKVINNIFGDINITDLFNMTREELLAAVYSRNMSAIDKCAWRTSAHRDAGTPILTHNKKMKELYAFVEKAAKSNSTITISGESGTGKEVIARFIHENSPRRKSMFLPVNCAAIPHELMESEFFGYDKGAFTGASREGKPGFFEIADGGSLFLDEIGELPLPLQSKLLRVLETGDIIRIGSNKVMNTDVRIIAATNKNLYTMLGEGSFREDLYYRLHIIPVRLPPLRERKDDIEFLASQFLCDLNKKYKSNKRFSSRTLAAFKEYDWPGNIRELKNVVERLVIVSAAVEIDIKKEALHVNREGPEPASAVNGRPSVFDFGSSYREAVETFEKAYIQSVIESCNGNISTAAKSLGLHRSSIYKKLGADSLP